MTTGYHYLKKNTDCRVCSLVLSLVSKETPPIGAPEKVNTKFGVVKIEDAGQDIVKLKETVYDKCEKDDLPMKSIHLHIKNKCAKVRFRMTSLPYHLSCDIYQTPAAVSGANI